MWKICDPLAAGMCPAVQITFDARGSGKMNGLADFVAQEEMDRYRGFWWAPNGKKIAYEQVMQSIYQSIEFYTKEKILSERARKRTIDILLLEQETQR